MIEFDFSLTRPAQGGHAFSLAMDGEIAAGDFVTLFGASGAGKSTLLRLMAGLETPTRGRLVVDGELWLDTERGVSLPVQSRAIGLVFQDYALFPNMSVRENLRFAAGKNQDSWVAELLEITGLATLAERLPAMLSGGQKQRVALARALARKPRLLFLDEPLSALDLSLRLKLQQELLQLHQRFDLTTVLVSHDLSEVFRLSNRVLVCESGRIVKHGTPQALFLEHAVAGNRLTLSAELIAKRQSDVVWIMTLLVGQDLIEVIATADEAARFAPGDRVAFGASTFGASLSPAAPRA
ncbi:ABC transporter ATP-binding protein [Crenobacter cavernae]|uniref:ATP-binding cassette domain-containing protein n=1 Tax=Crenobacter cavernae TaxID=2290923 RepID=A0ABY0FF01_9NEIS|nr:ATP-binding cassette domain-containing protein [Crenobacter cavernae]RXZ44883.1 ATP-binding cassette domain-containing protein [Crenobacter cavernae]